MNERIVQRIFFAILLAFVTGAFLWVIRGFLQPIFWAVALAILVSPVHARIERALSTRATLAAAASVTLVVLIVIMPLIGVGMAVTAEANALYARLRGGEIDLTQLFAELREHVPQLLAFMESTGLDPERLQSQLSSSAVQLSQLIASRALAIGQDTLRITVYFFLMLYLLFFFLRDGERMLDAAMHALPLGDARERLLLGRFAEVSRATLKGTLVVAVVQGTIGGIAFSALGIGSPVLWGVAMAVLSILPVVGSALIWFPAAVVLILSDRLIAGVALIIVGALVMGVVDNLLRPVLVGRDTRMPDYLILLSTLGGLAAFGLAGVVIGPIIAAFFLAVWGMAAEEFSNSHPVAPLHDPELPPPAPKEPHRDKRE
ncbi:MAG TPA: AI-2E family transporter [Gammaproteobacteria bacterium]|jgi:predicted PurR-regulated permease PerM